MKRCLFVSVMLALVLTSSAAAANIVVTNTSSLPDAEVADALPAFQRALDEDFAAVWPVARGSKLFLGTAPSDAWEIRIVDSPECVFCAGYHDVDDAVPYAVVSLLDDWHLTFTHELWEMLVNPYADRVAIVRPKQKNRVYALETADPVEAEKFAYVRPSAGGRPVRISDFVTPAWFQRGSAGPWDFSRDTKRPLQLLEDGYQVYLKNGAWDAIWAGAAAKVDGRMKAARWNARRATSPRASTNGYARHPRVDSCCLEVADPVGCENHHDLVFARARETDRKARIPRSNELRNVPGRRKDPRTSSSTSRRPSLVRP